jgi:hypothetical protein
MQRRTIVSFALGPQPRPFVALIAIGILFTTFVAAAFDAQVTDLTVAGQSVRASFALRDAFPKKFIPLLEQGAPLYLRLEAELWEDRPVWDRLAGPATVVSFRVSHDGAKRQVSITSEDGETGTYPAFPDPVSVTMRVGRADRILDSFEYYVNAIATIGTIEERDIEGAGDAVFGRESDSSVTALGRLVIRKILQLNEYLQSVSTRIRSRKFSGRQMKAQP